MIPGKKLLAKYSVAAVAVLALAVSLTSCKKTPEVTTKIRVLFIGNSLTYMNDLPSVLAGLAKSRAIDVEYDMYAPGGYKLSQHASDPQALEKINKGDWDFVILQEQGQMPAFSQQQEETEVYPYARKLCQMARDANPRAQVAFYMTMARRNGDQQNAAAFPELATYEGMQRRINFGYTQMAEQNQALLIPVGVAWQKVRSQRPDLDIYGDDLHPNITGTYLAACVFYGALFKDNPVGLPYPKQIDGDTAGYLQKLAQETISAKQE